MLFPLVLKKVSCESRALYAVCCGSGFGIFVLFVFWSVLSVRLSVLLVFLPSAHTLAPVFQCVHRPAPLVPASCHHESWCRRDRHGFVCISGAQERPRSHISIQNIPNMHSEPMSPICIGNQYSNRVHVSLRNRITIFIDLEIGTRRLYNLYSNIVTSLYNHKQVSSFGSIESHATRSFTLGPPSFHPNGTRGTYSAIRIDIMLWSRKKRVVSSSLPNELENFNYSVKTLIVSRPGVLL